jgi:prolyl-tRNA synthetase
VVIWPVLRGDDGKAAVLAAVHELAGKLRAERFLDRPIEVETDVRDLGGGDKQWEWIKKGVPLRIEIGPRDLASGSAPVMRRDRGPKDKETIPLAELPRRVPELLLDIQRSLFARALEQRDVHTRALDTRADFDAFFTPENADKPELHGGFALSHWCGRAACEEVLKDALKVTIRVVPTYGIASCKAAERLEERGACIVCGGASERRVVFAKSY